MSTSPQVGLVTVNGACDYLGGISRATIYRLVVHHELAPVRIGARTFFAVRDLDAFIKKNTDRKKAS